MAYTYLPAEDSTIALQQQVARLQALLEASRQIHAAVRLEDAMKLALQIIVRELEVQGAHFTAPPLTYGEVPPAPFEGCLRMPLYDKEGRELTELVVAPNPAVPLGLYEEDFVQGVALQASVAIENAHYHERNVAWVRLEHDLAAARAIQKSLLPQTMPNLPGYKLALRSSACYEVGGDYADILTLASGEVMMIVADVAGKGLASAIMSTAFRSAFRAMATSGLSLSDIAIRLNQEHWGEGAEARLRYVTAIFLKLDAAAGHIEVVNAGHSPGFLIDHAGFRQIDACGPPLGILPGSHYSSEQFEFAPGARLLLYTDGLTDQLNEKGEEFGAERLAADFLNSPAVLGTAGGKAILDHLWEQVFRFADGVDKGDDMTALVLCRESGGVEAAW